MESDQRRDTQLIVSEEALDAYVETYSRFLEVVQDELVSRELRLFDIRVRIAIDMIVGFWGNVSYTKILEVAESYAFQIRLVELWNAYEALLKYLKSLGLSRDSEPKYKQIKPEMLLDTGARETAKECLEKLSKHYHQEPKFKDEFNQYIGRIQNVKSSNLAQICASTIEYFTGNKDFSGYELFALVYAERNLYLHDGESAKLGWGYKRRNLLLVFYSEHFAKCLLQIATFVLQQQIHEKSR